MTQASIITTKLPTGIEVRPCKNNGTALRISFMYRGVRCRETLDNLTATKSNIKYAVNQRAAILLAIGRGTFDYAKEFPNSKRLKQFRLQHSGDLTIRTLLEKYETRIENQLEHSTKRGYQNGIRRYLKPVLDDIVIRDLKPGDISDMISNMVAWNKQEQQYLHLKVKTVRNYLVPLNEILQDALANKQIADDPMKHIFLKRILPAESFQSGYVIEPFTKMEVNTILESLAAPEQQAEKNLLQFWFFTGLRPSELMALEWDDIDFTKGLVHINKAIVLKRLKKPKTKSGIREVMLLPPALQALQAQKPLTFCQYKHVFINPMTDSPFIDDQQIRRLWQRILADTGVKYRNVYQCRHTYASTMLSNGENMLWVASQLGHRDTEMVTRVYGRWLPDANETGGYKCANDWGNFLEGSAPSVPL